MRRPRPEGQQSYLFWKDEILQALYWLHGEGLGARVSLEQLASLLGSTPEIIAPYVGLLVEEGLLHSEADTYVLTENGRKEGGIRFASAFQGLQKAGHGECGPDCDCQWEGKDQCQHQHIH